MGVLERFSLRGKVALVTAGAGPLFGQSISLALAEAGATVVTASRSLARNEEFAAQMKLQGHDVHGLAFDLEDVHSIDALHNEVSRRFGQLNVLVNSALARDGHGHRFEDESPEQWRRAAEGDFVGLFRHCQQAVATMTRQGGGSIINIASIYGMVSNDPAIYRDTSMVQPPTYNFIKAGMINFTRYLACYYGRQGIRANCLSPGGYFNHQPEPFLEKYCERTPLGRMLGQADIQGAVVFLASDASAYVTGVNLPVDGGWTCH